MTGAASHLTDALSYALKSSISKSDPLGQRGHIDFRSTQMHIRARLVSNRRKRKTKGGKPRGQRWVQNLQAQCGLMAHSGDRRCCYCGFVG